ncbi:hypothetical protein PrNR1418_33250 [Providencia rettgeri]|nr:hypothetical protein PrNR1418_33250 [Providencia rettgeri]
MVSDAFSVCSKVSPGLIVLPVLSKNETATLFALPVLDHKDAFVASGWPLNVIFTLE